MTQFSLEDRSTQDMAYEATTEALNDADMSLNDVDAVVASTVDTLVSDERQRHYPCVVSSLFKRKMPIIRIPAVCGGGGAAFWTALRLKFNNILVLGTDKISCNKTETITKEILAAAERVYSQQEGLVFPAENALLAQQHMLKFGTTTDDLAEIAFKNHENAFLNPKANFYQKRVTLDAIKSSPVVASPFRLFDCSISVNGAAAAIISKDKTDIEVAGSGMATDYLFTFDRESLTELKATKIAAEEAYKQAGIGPEEVNIAEVHDAFTILELMAYEDLGFCKKGEGSDMIREGIVKIDGKLPVNTSGGLKARGHPISPTGVAQIYEVVKQLRGQAKERQVSDAKYGLTENKGGVGASITVHVFKKVGG
ncbi:MAG: thiolase domain-containing protein [Nanoarchaeota archaeon]|nr:thiolase domain-containing protein [Nanoarchaeota archaeon]